MVEKKTKPEMEAKAAKPEAKAKAAPKAAKADKPVAKQAADKKPAAKSGAKVTIQQVGSAIGRQEYQRATLIGLGLNKLNRTRTLEDTPSVRGMIEKVKHLVKVVE